jgi:nicotinate phosphoribosyltransferase
MINKTLTKMKQEKQTKGNTDNRAMLTDLYQLTMNAAYLENNKDDIATFDLFVRKLPQDWGYFIANGIEDAVDYTTNLKFTRKDIAYLREEGFFAPKFLNFLKDFKFQGDIYAVKEGTPVFPNQPILRVTGKRTQAQLLETMLLNTINFQTMIATKANRVVNAAYPAAVVDYGLRRAQEKDAALKGARAAYIGGAIATSNVMAGKVYGIPIKGTHAHSFVMSFPTELEAFRAYAKTFQKTPTLLIDTYDTIQGAKNAVIIAKELEQTGNKLGSVRLDSGNLAKLANEVRTIFDENGLNYVNILASNDLNEYKIAELKEQGARINGYGVGTELITAKPTAAIPGVYKLVEDGQGGRIKLADEKKNYPGKKQVYRVEEDGKYAYDLLALENEQVKGIPLLEKIVENGQRTIPRRNLAEIRQYALEEVAKLPQDLKQVKAGQYQMKISPKLTELVDTLTNQYKGGNEK